MSASASPLSAELQQAPALFETFLARFFQENTERYAYGDLFEPLYLDMTEFVTRRGKRIRPMLMLGSYRIFGGDRLFDDRSVLRAAVSLELLHAFILIHDDVIDQSERRRRLPTFHKLVEERLGKIDGAPRVGENVALVVGDILFAMAVDTLRSTDFAPGLRDAALSHFLHYISDTGAGEIYDILLGTRDIARVEEADIMRMYTLKTTRYTFEAPLVLGALLAGVGEDLLRELAELIEPVGIAFQIQNDLIEYQQFKGVDRLRQTDILERCGPQFPPALPEHARFQRRLGQQDRAAHRQIGGRRSSCQTDGSPLPKSGGRAGKLLLHPGATRRPARGLLACPAADATYRYAVRALPKAPLGSSWRMLLLLPPHAKPAGA